MRQKDRRSFLRAVAAAGIGTTISGAAAAQLPRVELDRSGFPDAERILLNVAPTVARITGGGSAKAPGPKPGGALPALTSTPRAQALGAIEAAPGGAELLNSLGIERGRPMAQVPGRGPNRTGTGPAGDVGLNLAAACASGVTLYASGAMSPVNLGGSRPLSYTTVATSASSWDPPVREWVRISPGCVPTIGDLMLWVQMDSPVGTRRDVPYCLKMDFRGNGDMDTTINGTPISWVQTSKGTLFALAQLSGKPRFSHGYSIEIKLGSYKHGFSREFHWFHVTQL